MEVGQVACPLVLLLHLLPHRSSKREVERLLMYWRLHRKLYGLVAWIELKRLMCDDLVTRRRRSNQSLNQNWRDDWPSSGLTSERTDT